MVIIKKSKIHGKGIFADKNYKKGKIIFRFSNRVIKINHKEGCHCKICKRCIQITKMCWLYPKKKSYGWYLNHSCNPSAGIKSRNIVALNNIKKDEEITIDYSTTNTDKKWKMKCRCNNKNCRKVLRSVQYLQKEYLEKYKGFMPKYVELHFSRTS